MNRNALYIIIAVLVVAIVVLGWQYYQDRQTKDLQINIGGSGVSVKAN